MRGVRAFLALAVLLASSVALAASAPPHLKVSALSPKVVLRGTGFEAREWVAVTVAGQGVKRFRVRATFAGAFRVALVPPPAASCGRYLVRAQ